MIGRQYANNFTNHTKKPFQNALRLDQNLIFGSFSVDDGDGSETVTFKKNARLFKLCPVYSSSLKMSDVEEFPWSGFLEDRTQVQNEKQKFVAACLRPP